MREAVLPALRWTALGRLGAQALSLAATLVVVRILGPAEYGLFALCMAPVTFLGALVVVAPSCLVIRASAPREDTRRATGLLVALVALATLAMAPVAAAIAWSQEDERVLALCVALTAFVLWPHALSAAWQASFERRLDFRAVSMVELASGLASTVATVGCALAGAGVWALAAGAAAASATQFLLLLAAMRGDALPSFDFRRLARADAAYGGRVVLGTLVTQALEAAETFLLARFLGAAELGAWRTTRELVNVPMGKAMPIVNRVGFPAYARLGGDAAAARHYALLSLQVFAAVFVPAYWGLAAVAPHAVPLAMGAQWAQAVPLAAIFGLFLPFRLLQYCLVLPHQGLGNAALVNRATLLAGGGALAGLAAGLSFGAAVAAACMALAGAVGLVLAADRARRPLGLSWGDIAGGCAPTLIAAAAMVAAVTAARLALPPDWSHAQALAALVPLGVAVHGAAFLALDRGRLLRPALSILRDIACRR